MLQGLQGLQGAHRLALRVLVNLDRRFFFFVAKLETFYPKIGCHVLGIFDYFCMFFFLFTINDFMLNLSVGLPPHFLIRHDVQDSHPLRLWIATNRRSDETKTFICGLPENTLKLQVFHLFCLKTYLLNNTSQVNRCKQWIYVSYPIEMQLCFVAILIRPNGQRPVGSTWPLGLAAPCFGAPRLELPGEWDVQKE